MKILNENDIIEKNQVISKQQIYRVVYFVFNGITDYFDENILKIDCIRIKYRDKAHIRISVLLIRFFRKETQNNYFLRLRDIYKFGPKEELD